MDHIHISRQIIQEHDNLAMLIHALRNTIGWTFHEHQYDLVRKLSSLRFMFQSFQRHFDHLLSLEERGGYIEQLTHARPDLNVKVAELMKEHQSFRQEETSIARRLQDASAEDPRVIERLCEDLLAFLQWFDNHSARETEMLRVVVTGDSGDSQTK